MVTNINNINKRIEELCATHNQLIIAIDGRCAAGKTTLAWELKRQWDCSVVHMDDFFLRPNQRTEKRYNEAGGNVDYERVLEEVLLPLSRHENALFAPYDCKTQTMKAKICIEAGKIIIVEGAYSCHPSLWPYYNITIFMDVDSNEQLTRIKKRNGIGNLKMFQEKWIPLEEKYFAELGIDKKCDFYLE